MKKVLVAIFLFCFCGLPFAKYNIGIAGYQNYHSFYIKVASEIGFNVIELTRRELSELNAISRYDIIIVSTGIAAQVGLPPDVCAALTYYVLTGGKLILEQHALDNFTTLPIYNRATSAKFINSFKIVNSEHPITKTFQINDNFNYRAWATIPILKDSFSGVVLARAESGEPILIAVAYGEGLIIYSGACISFAYMRDPKYHLLIDNIIQFAKAFQPTKEQLSLNELYLSLSHEAEALKELSDDLRRFQIDSTALQKFIKDYKVNLTMIKRIKDNQTRRKKARQALWQATNTYRLYEAKLMDKLSRKSGKLPKDTSCNWRWNIRVTNIKYPKELTEPDALKLAYLLYKAGINCVLTEGLRQHLAISESEHQQNIKATKIFTAACHKLGIRVIHHCTAAFTTEEYFEANRQWSQIDARSGAYAFFPGYGGVRMFCLNNPDFRIAYFSRLKEFVEATDIDGLMVDEVEWLPDWYVCGCSYCRALFKQRKGYELPPASKESIIWGNFEEPIWRAWLKFRMESGGEFYQAIKQNILNKPGKAFLGCLAGASGTWAPFWGMSAEEFMKAHNITFYEAEASPGRPFSYFYSWRRHFAELKYYLGIGAHFDAPALTLFYPISKEEQFFCWALAKALSHRLWIIGGGPLHPYVKENTSVFLYERAHEDLFLKPSQRVAQIAVLFSAQTRDSYKGYSDKFYVNEWSGCCQILAEANLQYDVILDADINNLKKLRGYELLILPNAACLSTQQVQKISEYIKAGGNVIATYETSIYDELGNKLNKFRLTDDALAYHGEINLPATRLQPNANSIITKQLFKNIKLPLELSGEFINIAPAKNKKSYQVLATIDGEKAIPIILSYGAKRGQLVYFAFKLFQLYHHPGAKPGDIWQDKREIWSKQVLLNCIDYLIGNKLAINFKGVSPGIIITAYQQKNSRQQRRLLFHIINIQGSIIEPGELIKEDYLPVYPPIKSQIQIEVNKSLGKIKSAKIVSPDFDGFKLLNCQTINNKQIIMLPKGSFRRYGIIIAELVNF